MAAARVDLAVLISSVLAVLTLPAAAQTEGPLLSGEAAFGGWRDDAPGVRRLIRAEDLPPPGASRSSSSRAGVISRPDGARPRVPDGFEVELFAEGFARPRVLRVAPNGDIFVAESGAGRIRVMRATDGASEPTQSSVFADGLRQPYGIGFYPPGPEPKYVYVAEPDRVVRYPYENGDLKARAPAERIVDGLPTGGHWTRDIAFSPDGGTLFVAVGSASNVARGMGGMSAAELAIFQAEYGVGASWGSELFRASVLAFDPEGSNRRIFATGIRNCSELAVQPHTGDLWCATNERDGLGDNLPPDYATRVHAGKFYGWPWYYIGDNEDPRHVGARPDLADQVTVPDVLIQAHSAPLGITFYDGAAFPGAYRGDGFVALHGSWNRADRTGYKVVRLLMKDGEPTGEYQDFMTGFVVDGGSVWGRPVGVAVARDGALLVSEDGNGTIWRVTPVP